MVPMRKIRGNYVSNGTLFDTWLITRLNENFMTMSDVAEKLRYTRQSMSNIKTGKLKPNFVMIVALCWIFGMKDDPNEIYSYVEKDWS